MSSSMDTIEIVGGVHAGTKRLQLKSVLERYGEIDICHKDWKVQRHNCIVMYCEL